MKNQNKHKAKGFTLLEILLVIGLIATLAVIVVVALDPGKRFEDARNSRRLSDIQSILSAIQQSIVDSKGGLPDGITDSWNHIGKAGSSCNVNTDNCSVSSDTCIDLSSELARYLKELPYDPENGDFDRTRYAVKVDENNIITVTACDSTDPTISSVSR